MTVRPTPPPALLRIAVAVTVVGLVSGSLLRERARQVRRSPREAGFTTIEWVVIALGLFLIAGIAVAAITAAVNGRLSQISPTP